MKHIALNTAIKKFDFHRGRPIRLTNPERLLQISGWLWKVGEWFFDEQFRRFHRKSETRRTNDPDVTPNSFGFRVFDSRQEPIASRSRLTFFKVQTDQLPTGYILCENGFQVTKTICNLTGSEIIRNTCSCHGDDGVIRGNTEIPFADWGFANIKFNVGPNHTIGLSQLIQQQFRHTHFGLNSVGSDSEGMRCSREPVNIYLSSLDRFAGKLFRGQLRQTRKCRGFQSNRTKISQSQKSGVANRPHRFQTQPLHSHRERPQWSLATNTDLRRLRDGLTERHIQLPQTIFVAHLPGNDIVSLHIKDLTWTTQNHAQRSQFSLQHLIIQLMILSQQTRSDACLNGTRCRKKQFAFSCRAFRLPFQMHTSTGRQKSNPGIFLPQRHYGLLIAVEGHFRIESLKTQRHHRTGSDRKIDPPLTISSFVDFRDKIQFDRKRSGLGKANLVNSPLSCRG